MTSTVVLIAVAVLSFCSSTVWMQRHHHRPGPQCPPQRYTNFHIQQLVGLWYQYVYQITDNSASLYSCETFNITNEGSGYVAASGVANLAVSRFSVSELPGPTFYYINEVNTTFQFTEIVTSLDRNGNKISIANIFIDGDYNTTFVLLASRRTYPDPRTHERLLHSVGVHISANSSTVLPSQCPTLVVDVPLLPLPA